MLKLINAVFAFLFPIVRAAVLQAVADIIVEFAYPKERDTEGPAEAPFPGAPIGCCHEQDFVSYVEQDIQETMDLFGSKGA